MTDWYQCTYVNPFETPVCSDEPREPWAFMGYIIMYKLGQNITCTEELLYVEWPLLGTLPNVQKPERVHPPHHISMWQHRNEPRVKNYILLPMLLKFGESPLQEKLINKNLTERRAESFPVFLNGM